MPNKTGFVLLHKPMFRKPSRFEERWGEPAHAIAKREDVTTTTIHMRVRNYGSPYQRATKPTISEKICGKTNDMLSRELNLHQVSVQQRLYKYKNPYITYVGSVAKEFPNHKSFVARKVIWLMPEHPDHDNWVAKMAVIDAKLKADAGYTG